MNRNIGLSQYFLFVETAFYYTWGLKIKHITKDRKQKQFKNEIKNLRMKN